MSTASLRRQIERLERLKRQSEKEGLAKPARATRSGFRAGCRVSTLKYQLSRCEGERMIKAANKRRLEKLRTGVPDNSWRYVVFFMSANDKAAAAELARLRAAGVRENEIAIVRWLDNSDPGEDRAIWEGARSK